MRIDKFLKVASLIKRRTLANEACSAGRVSVNGKEAKSGTVVKTGDIIEIRFGSGVTKVEVLKLLESTKKEDAEQMFALIDTAHS